MADTKREIERKYESDDSGLPDLTGVAGVAAVLDQGVADLDATYYDTADERLAASSITLRRRTGGSDAGWHLKFPVESGVRDEIHAPLSDHVPSTLGALVRSRVRDDELAPVVRLRSTRDVRHLVDVDGHLLAEVSVDAVRAERLTGGGGKAEWTEIEVELADGGDPAFLDKVDKRLRKAGVRPADFPSKLARALAETGGKGRSRKEDRAEPVTAGDHVLAYVRTQRDEIVDLDPAVRRDLEDSVHRMRVATRRMRATFRSYRKVLDRAVTDPVGVELKWLAGELGASRDHEVLAERISDAVEGLPPGLVTGPVRNRLRTWSKAKGGDTRRQIIDVLNGPRYLALLTSLDALLADPPLRAAAAGKPSKVLAEAVDGAYDTLAGLVEQALGTPPGRDRDVALHEARKKAKRARYAAETAAPALGKPASKLVSSLKDLQKLLGEHQDSVMCRQALRELAEQAHAAGENAFTYGVLHAREERRAAEVEEELPGVWKGMRGGTGL
ncbi:CYTH and CHAD domain-containing protein [Streptomyces chromofuscus]|uniref:CYTH and CHAD domain-containing protein n=1 Tax=Streptomyces chromofuscus TaxID=42881 RepID=A0A7M2TDS7_STRCW|nr:CYTH and CHAD domain-containing protein [Streptomyces chromofuscus]QOV46662.1 CYTH and CHAD domain-containing protein [Streptomyces chromofuscus]GGT08601.1 CHAD domain-containing protein [Streptomyces chromofuscus]